MKTQMPTTQQKRLRGKILKKALVYEMRNGKPIYYNNYKQVLRGTLMLEQVMASSALHSLLLQLILHFLYRKLGREWVVLSGEVGFQWDKKQWRSLDIAIFERSKVEPYLTTQHYIPVAPLIVIEIDTKADLESYPSLQSYMYEKVQDLLNAGVQKVIWYTTQDKRVLIAERGKQDWIISTWDRTIELTKGVSLNLSKLLDAEGVTI